jgi:hypothetical protein
MESQHSVTRGEGFIFMHQEYIRICNTGNAEEKTDLTPKCKTAELVTVSRGIKVSKKIHSLYAIKSPDQRDYGVACSVCLAAS